MISYTKKELKRMGFNATGKPFAKNDDIMQNYRIKSSAFVFTVRQVGRRYEIVHNYGTS